MLTRLFVTILFGSQILLAQDATIPPDADRDGEAAFQTTVRGGLRPADTYSASVFVLNHEDIAIPVLLQAIRENLGNKNTQEFVSRAAELVAYAASNRGMDAVAELCSLDPKRFTPLIERLLNHAINRNREYEIVYHAIDTDPNIRDAVVRWLEESLTFPQADVALARELLRREKAGHSISDNDAVMASLPMATRERVLRAVEKARNDERERQNKER
jgi:hypothetical protein